MADLLEAVVVEAEAQAPEVFGVVEVAEAETRVQLVADRAKECPATDGH